MFFNFKIKKSLNLTVTPGATDTPSPQENFGFGRNLVQVDSIPTQVTTT